MSGRLCSRAPPQPTGRPPRESPRGEQFWTRSCLMALSTPRWKSGRAFIVEEILIEDGRVTGIRGKDRAGKSVTDKALIVIGAEGNNSMVAKAVKAPEYNQRDSKICTFYTYWRDVHLLDGFQLEFYPRVTVDLTPGRPTTASCSSAPIGRWRSSKRCARTPRGTT